MTIKKDELQAQITYRLIESLSTSEKRYETLVENLQEVVFESDIKGNFKFLNRVWKSMLGYSIKESLGRSLCDFVFEDDRMSCVKLFDFVNERKPINKKDTLRFFHKKGHLLWLVVSIATDDKRKVSGSLHNITELQETTVSKEYVDNIIKAMVDTLIVTDAERNIKTVNQATLDLLGYKEDELIGKPVGILFEKEDDLFKDKRLERLEREGSVRNFDITYKTKAGEKIPVSFSGSVMKDNEGKNLGIVGAARDMSATKKLIIELEKTKDELQDKVNDLEKFTDIAVGRELKMSNMEKEIEMLKKKRETKDERRRMKC